tara:strand:+ start:1727 stop:1951 length:225 start_codon:yes stop_codon:yes gene_type:complete
MAVRVDLKLKRMTVLDDVVQKAGDTVMFDDVSELDPPIPERVALLKLCALNEIIPDVGVRLNDDTYLVQQTSLL